MDWPLAWIIAAGTLPGLLAGWWLRVHWLRDPGAFKLFVGLVLLFLGIRLLRKKAGAPKTPESGPEQDRRPSPAPILLVALIIGIVGGAYGIGGGSLMSPVLVTIFCLSVHRIAGAALFGTFVTSVVGVMLYQFLPAPSGVETRPDWALGILFGLGGVAGMYVGARTQKNVPQRALELGIAAVISILACGYVGGYV